MTKNVTEIKLQMDKNCKEVATQDNADAAALNSGIYLTTNGNAYLLKSDLLSNNVFEKIEPGLSALGYLYIDAKYFDSIKGNKEIEIMIDGNMHAKVYGKYLHEMVVYSFGDSGNSSYKKPYLPVDHINQNHLDNRVENLKIVTTFENLIRWVCATNLSDKAVKTLNDYIIEKTKGNLDPQNKIQMFSSAWYRIANYNSSQFVEYLNYITIEEGGDEKK